MRDSQRPEQAPDPRSDHEQFLQDLERLCTAARAALPDSGKEPPCFAHMRLRSDGKTRDFLLGWRTLTRGAVTLLHWQTAPLAEVFFSTRPGEDYELEVGDRTLSGTLLDRSLLEFAGGVLREVVTPSATYSRAGSGPWQAGPRKTLRCVGPRGSEGPRLPPPWTRAALDAEQRRAVELPPGSALLVLGEAGCGKTTVALHRVAALREQAEHAGRPFRALVLVPAAGAGLRHLSASLLDRLGVPESAAEVAVFDAWAGAQARRAFAKLPRRQSRDAPPAVVQIKRHPALRDALGTLRKRGGQATATRADLLHLFGDQELLTRVAREAAALGSPVTGRAVAELLEHTRVQFCPTTEQAHTHVDADRLVTVDGLRIDEGTPMDDAGSIDPEDYAVLFALAARRGTRAAPGPGPTLYDCVVVDEAQELAPIELELIGRAVRPGGTLIVAGDEAQQVDPSACFAGWPAAMQELGAATFQSVRLAVSYRCPPAVTTAARALRSGERARLPEDSAAGSAITFSREPSELHLVAQLIDGLGAVRDADPGASIAVICRTPEAAARTAQLLSRGIELHHVRDGAFRFAPGIEVTCVQDVKGLEFDYVVIPDASAAAYSDTPEARRAMYVAVTRPAQRLVLACAGTPTPLFELARPATAPE